MDKILLYVDGDDEGYSQLAGVISHEGDLWIVGTYYEPIDRRERIPGKLIRLSGLQYQEVNHPHYRYRLSNSIPMSVLGGIAQDGYEVADYPALGHTRGPISIQ